MHPSPDVDQHLPITIPESPSASTVVSSDTINTAPSGLSSEILGESISPRSSVFPDGSGNTRTSQSTQLGQFTQHKRFFFEDGNITFLVRYLSTRKKIKFFTNFTDSGGWHTVSRPSLFLLP